MRHLLPLMIACGVCFGGAAASMAPAFAGTLQVNPVLAEIDADRRTATISVRNQEAKPVTIRAYPLGWSQPQGDDLYEETSAVIVSPPIFTIPAGGTQLIRVGMRQAAATPQAYRLIIEEVPEASGSEGIRVALRLNLPLYIRTPSGRAVDLAWTAERRADGGWTIAAANQGAGYVRLDSEAAFQATGIRFDNTIHFGTVLPGATRRWAVGPGPQIEDRARFQQVARTVDRVATALGSQ